ncbi:hypothetical protein BO99DRAFT_427863 [Aspergillus violaceofuscus CBS 115571]|uniref:Uncharacterized protein n=1 Tax=Aspergillus violaceofuscus (strain CBS 115571) TaxID=1450538 RepID=A0A2V5ILV0_ASPV1|nr:hypothetical protein BO99DRAFT_427863 [Aspergillus violaceofuscus CBS 115571]
MAELDPLLVPIQLDAFVLNKAMRGHPNEDGARICPITQPNYTSLRFDNGRPERHLGTGLPRRNRWGVYLHWTLPRVYRTGVATAAREEDEHGQEGVAPAQRSSSRSKCFDAPTRWLIIRKLALDSVRPVAAAAEVSEYEAWVVESDHVWHLDDISLEADF